MSSSSSSSGAHQRTSSRKSNACSRGARKSRPNRRSEVGNNSVDPRDATPSPRQRIQRPEESRGRRRSKVSSSSTSDANSAADAWWMDYPQNAGSSRHGRSSSLRVHHPSSTSSEQVFDIVPVVPQYKADGRRAYAGSDEIPSILVSDRVKKRLRTGKREDLGRAPLTVCELCRKLYTMSVEVVEKLCGVGSDSITSSQKKASICDNCGN